MRSIREMHGVIGGKAVQPDSEVAALMRTIQKMPEGSVVLVRGSSTGDILTIAVAFLRMRIGAHGVFLSSDRPLNDLLDRVKMLGFGLRESVRKGRICVVDMSSRSLGEKDVEGVIYVNSPSELSATQLAIEKAFGRLGTLPGSPFFFLDSLSTLCLYNEQSALLQFLHYLIGRLRIFRANGLLLGAAEALDERFLAVLRQFCDAEIDMVIYQRNSKKHGDE